MSIRARYRNRLAFLARRRRRRRHRRPRSGGSGSRSLFDRPPTISLCHTRGLALVFFSLPAVLSRARHHGFHFVNWHRRTFRSFVFALMFRPWCFEGGARAVARFHYERYTRAGNTAIAMLVEKRPT